MGNNSLTLIRSNFPSGKWTHLYSSFSRNIVQNQHEILGESQNITALQDAEKQVKMYVFRKLNPQYLVTIHDIITRQSSPLRSCTTCDQFQQFQIIVERIPYRLSDVGVLSFQQMIYVMQCCAKGLHEIWKQYGKNYYIDQDNICFNNEGKCKIWINQDLKNNFPAIQSNISQQTMISLLLEHIQTRISCQLPKYYSKLKKSMQFQKFAEFLNFINKIKQNYKINLDHIDSLVQKLPKNGDSDSKDAQSKYHKSLEKSGLSVSRNKSQKYSLRSKNNRQIMKTVHSKQEQTQVSRTDLYQNWLQTSSIDMNAVLMGQKQKPQKKIQKKSVISSKLCRQFTNHIKARSHTQKMSI